MASYTVLSSQSSIQVISPTVVLDTVTVTIQTNPSNVVATTQVLKSEFDAGTVGPLLTTFANNIEQIMSGGKVEGGTPSQSIDASGLIQDAIDFTVSYTPPGSPTGPLTVSAEVPVNLLEVGDALIGQTLFQEAETIIDDAYANLITLASG